MPVISGTRHKLGIFITNTKKNYRYTVSLTCEDPSTEHLDPVLVFAAASIVHKAPIAAVLLMATD